MSAGVYNIDIEQGATWSIVVTIKANSTTALDLTGYTGRAMIRKKYSSSTPAATITVTFDADRTTGKVTLSLTATETAAITCGDSTESSTSHYVWDFEIEKDTVVTRVLQGAVVVSPEATK